MAKLQKPKAKRKQRTMREATKIDRLMIAVDILGKVAQVSPVGSKTDTQEMAKQLIIERNAAFVGFVRVDECYLAEDQ